MKEEEVYLHPTIVAMSKKTPSELVEIYNGLSHPTRHSEVKPGEMEILNGLLLYYVLQERDVILPKKAKARFDKAKLSGRVFQDAFERLFAVWMGNRRDVFLAEVDSMVKGLDYVVCTKNPVEFKAGIQCRFSLSASGDPARVNNHYLRLKKDLDDARLETGNIPMAAVVYRTASNVPEPLRDYVSADHSTIFLNHSGVMDLGYRVAELSSLAKWLSEV